MKAHYVGIWCLLGAGALPPGSSDTQIYSRVADPKATATLTGDPDRFFNHMDTTGALAAKQLSAFVRTHGSAPKDFATHLAEERIERQRRTKKGVFLAFEAETDAPPVDLSNRADLGDFCVCLMGEPFNPDVRAKLRSAAQPALAGLSLSLPDNADRRIELLQDVIYLVDPSTDKPIYLTRISVRADVTLASPVSQEAIRSAASWASRIGKDEVTGRLIGLLIASLDRGTDKLLAFISAWAALEMFINKSFASYEPRWFEHTAKSSAPSARGTLDRFQTVMQGKYAIADKFLIIAAMLDPSAADADLAVFAEAKKIRDEMFHAPSMPVAALPTARVQDLVRKYVRLHLAQKQSHATSTPRK